MWWLLSVATSHKKKSKFVCVLVTPDTIITISTMLFRSHSHGWIRRERSWQRKSRSSWMTKRNTETRRCASWQSLGNDAWAITTTGLMTSTTSCSTTWTSLVRLQRLRRLYAKALVFPTLPTLLPLRPLLLPLLPSSVVTVALRTLITMKRRPVLLLPQSQRQILRDSSRR